jgi:signal transduction histidine kinase
LSHEQGAAVTAPAAGHDVPGLWQRVRTWLTFPRIKLAVALSLVPLAVTSILLSVEGGHLQYPAATAAYRTYLTVAPILVGLLWWRRRPTNRIGVLLVALGYLSWLLAGLGSDESFVFTIAALGDAPVTVLSLYLCLAFPTGRLETVAERLLIAALALILTVYYGSVLLFAPNLDGAGPLSTCGSACPGNPFQVSSELGLVEAVTKGATYLGLALVAGMAVVWVRRFEVATRPQRRALVPIACSSLLLVPALFTVYFATLVLEVGQDTYEVLTWVLVGVYVVFPLGFAVALLQADLFAGRALGELFHELAAWPTLAQWRDAVARAIDDPSLRIAYRDPSSDLFHDEAGAEVVPPAGTGKVWMPVKQGNEDVAALVVDEALVQEPELVGAATEATRLALETRMLATELRSSRAQVLEAADAERQRIGRDLHDSAQQRLVALRVHLSLTRDRLDRPEDRALLDELGRELDAALEELRSVAQGLYPVTLAHYGLTEALRSVCREAALPVEIVDERLERHPGVVELTAYFCCLEAVQNAAKHAGDRARVAITLGDDEAGGLRFTVEDDGAGFDPEQVTRGAGLTNLHDRIAAVGGSLRIESARGRGTCVSGSIPA